MRNFPRTLVAGSALLALGALLIGCNRSADVAGRKAAQPTTNIRNELTPSGQKPAANDTLMMYYPQDPDTLNPLTSNDTVSSELLMYVYEGLATRDFADPDTFKPMLAESWEFDEDTLTYTIRLRKGVQWHPIKRPDGTMVPPSEVTSRDVKFTFDTVLNENVEAAALRSYYVNPDAQEESDKYKIQISVVDKYTIKIKWSEPYLLMDEFTLGAMVIPEHVYGRNEKGEPITLDYRNSREFAELFNNHWANTQMCGTGPLIFEEWIKEQQASFRRNPNYWGEPFYFSRVVYRQVSNPNTALQLVLQNELDWVYISEKDLYVQSKNDPRVKSGDVDLVDFFYPGYRYIGYNQSRELFQDKNVRWALGHAVPVQQIIDKIYHGLAEPISGPFLPGSPANDESLEPVEYDLARARQLLEEAGWVDTNGNALRDKMIGGQRVEARFDLMIYADSPQYRQIAEIIKENCRKIGVEVQITPTKWALMLQKLRKKEFDACILGWALSWKADPFQIWHGSQANLPESSNSIGYANPQVDVAIEELRRTVDPERQNELYREIHRLIYEDQPYTFLFADRRTAGHHQRLKNIHFYKIRPCFDVHEWFSSQARNLAR